jgi:hypothetical protein
MSKPETLASSSLAGSAKHITFTVGESRHPARGRCDFMKDFVGTRQTCSAPGAYWYPAMGGGVCVLCGAHGAKHFPNGAQRISDMTWHGGGDARMSNLETGSGLAGSAPSEQEVDRSLASALGVLDQLAEGFVLEVDSDDAPNVRAKIRDLRWLRTALPGLLARARDAARNQRIVDLVSAAGSRVERSINSGFVVVVDGRTGLGACERSASDCFDMLLAEADAAAARSTEAR